MKQLLIQEIENLVVQIEKTTIPTITIDIKQIDTKFQIINSMIKKQPLNIVNYTKILIPINKGTCISCERQAQYMNSHVENEKYCWLHSQNL
jgi:hypothetical protein